MFFAAAHHSVIGFLVTGGSNGSARLSSTEITVDGITFADFTPLPFAINDHCLVALDLDDDGDFFLGGGDIDSAPHNKRAFVHRGSQWVEVNEMPTARQGKKPTLELQNELSLILCLAGLECGPLRASPGGRVEKIVAAGGRETNNAAGWTASVKVEIYDITSNTWETGGNFLAKRHAYLFPKKRAIAL